MSDVAVVVRVLKVFVGSYEGIVRVLEVLVWS